VREGNCGGETEGGGRYSPLLSSIAERRDCVLQVCVFKRGI